MDLRSYFSRPGAPLQTEFAARLDMKIATINHYVHGRRTPSFEVALTISEATGGLVSVGELLANAIPDGYELRKIEQDDTDDAQADTQGAA